ncbi:MAG: tetratricopeptide repeat protein [Myxococcota bacterium]
MPRKLRVKTPPPVAAPIVGRSDVMERLQALLPAGGVVTLVGPPGIGKSRLAAAYPATDTHDESRVVDLANAGSTAEILAGIKAALGITLESEDPESVGHALAGWGRLLLIVDNVERVVAEVRDLVDGWTSLSPETTFLVTSRERLHAEAEVLVELGPLRLPPKEGASVDEIASTEATALLLARARGFALDEDNAPVVAKLLHELDGIPLAIELLAARLHSLGVHELYQRMHRRFDILRRSPRTGVRQATLRGALDGSWELLSEEEQRGLAAASVFRSGFTLDAAEQVLAGGAEDALEILSSLRDKSLVRAVPASGGRLRYDLFASIRAYADEKLGESERKSEVQRRHASYFRDRATKVIGALPMQEDALRWLDQEAQNLVAAFEYAWDGWNRNPAALAAPASLGLAVDAALRSRGPVSVLERVLDQLLAAPGFADIAPDLRAGLHLAHARVLRRGGNMKDAMAAVERGLAASRESPEAFREADLMADAGEILQSQGELDAANERFEAALETAERRADDASRSRVLRGLGLLHHSRGKLTDAYAAYDRALTISRHHEDRPSQARILTDLGSLRLQQGRLDEARELYESALELLDAMGKDPMVAGLISGNLGILEQELGNLEIAEGHYQRSLQSLRRAGARHFLAHLLGYFGGLQHERGRYVDALRNYDEALTVLRVVGDRRLEGLFLAARGAALAARDLISAAEESFVAAKPLLEDIDDPGLILTLEIHRSQLLLARSREAFAVDDGELGSRLRADAEAVLRRAEGTPELLRGSDDARFATRVLQAALTTRALVVRRDGAEIVLPDGTVVDFEKRLPLRRVVGCLVRRRLENLGPVDAEELLTEGWPGERVKAEAAMNRVKVALSTLRKLGFRDILLRRQGGYLLDPEFPVVVEAKR